jgi:1-aminocyclopropane-1-carboxylate deaminase/D-cysteine desulfhydrase-like pyridoxal-dependent ACC family enzyme
MSKPYVIEKYPHLVERFPFHSIIEGPTPVHRLAELGKQFGHPELYVKREDLTHSLYGGNKVRNLEFVLPAAAKKGAKSIGTWVPYGSNFTGALSAHAPRMGLTVELSQFVALRNPQIEAHARFSSDQGARLITYEGKSGPVLSGIDSMLRAFQSKYYSVPPGGSFLEGALGHANAFLEMVQQCREKEMPIPDVIVVGAGTCGTAAGLLAGIHMAGVPTELHAVRCAERIVCNRYRIAKLTNSVLAATGAAARVTSRDVRLHESPENVGYAVPSTRADAVIRLFCESEGITLDTTYTSKVALFLEQALKLQEFRGRKLLYWHTYSSASLSRRAS